MPKYRVIAGSHSHSQFQSGPKKGKPIVYRQGDVFEHPNPRFHVIHKNKFEPVDDSTPVASLEWLELDITRMDEDGCRMYADEHGIDFPTGARLVDMQRLIARWFKEREAAKAKKQEPMKVK